MNLLKLILLGILASMTAGCTHYAMNSAIESWQGQNLTDVVTAWGTPSEEMKIEGKHLYIWNTCDDRLVSPGSSRPFSLKDPDCCARLLEADKGGRIVHGAWEGKGCPWLFTGWAR